MTLFCGTFRLRPTILVVLLVAAATGGSCGCKGSGSSDARNGGAAGEDGNVPPLADCTAETPRLDCPCQTSGQLACNGARQKLVLICGTVSNIPGLVWSVQGTCNASSNCDQTDGACKTIVPDCIGKNPGFQYCDALPALDVQRTCGVDLVTATSQICSGVCLGGECSEPRCGDGKIEPGEVCDDGNGTPIDGCEPASAPAGVGCTRSRVTSLSLGNRHTCALYSGGYVRCWGNNEFGQLGLGHTNFEGTRRPFELTDGKGNPAGPIAMGGPVTALSAGTDFTCAILADQSVRCWGKNTAGQLGRGNTTSLVTSTPDDLGPVSVGGPVSAIAAGSASVCALLTNGTVRCWGTNGTANLGLGNIDEVSQSMLPSEFGPVMLGATATAVSAGSDHTCALLAGGTIRCWGDNFIGELGIGDDSDVSATLVPSAYSAVLLPEGRTPASISVGGSFSCARFTDNGLVCWGMNLAGQLGVGTTATVGDNESPATAGIALTPEAGVTSVVVGGDFTCAVYADDGGLHCWGHNDKGQLGYADVLNRGNTPQNLPNNTSAVPAIDFGGMLSAKSVHLGSVHSCALLSNEEVRCWGWNRSGQLGHTVGGSLPDRPVDFFGGSSGRTPSDPTTTVQVLPP